MWIDPGWKDADIADVFLTTIKPQEKVVTASDVQSSLYYVHVDSPEDYKLLKVEDSEDDQSVDDTRLYPPLIEQKSVRRKAFSQSHSLAHGDRPEPPPRPYTQIQAEYNHSSHKTYRTRRKAVSAVKKPMNTSLEQPPRLSERQVLGPRPMSHRNYTTDSSILQSVPVKQNVDLRRRSEQPGVTPPRLPPRPYSQVRAGSQRTDLAENKPPRAQLGVTNDRYSSEHGWEWEKNWQERRTSKDINDLHQLPQFDLEPGYIYEDRSLSLIRRYDGQQWNVGKINNTSTRSENQNIASWGAGISIEIMTSGYAKFTNPGTSDGESQANVESSNGHSSPLHLYREATSLSNDDKRGFRRHLRQTGLVKRPNQRHRYESTDSMIPQEVRPNIDSGSGSQHLDGLSSPTLLSSEQDTASLKRFTIQSPWDGICEFSAGIAGRSLKCKHSYRSGDPRFGPGVHSATVSELRFNLPSSKAFRSPATKSPTPGTPREAKRSSLFLNTRKKSSSSIFEKPDPASVSAADGYFGSRDDLENRLDLTLGQEHAGGGFGGKQAKLGKLIIEAEGLLMMDLIVAANVALWWRVYEKIM